MLHMSLPVRNVPGKRKADISGISGCSDAGRLSGSRRLPGRARTCSTAPVAALGRRRGASDSDESLQEERACPEGSGTTREEDPDALAVVDTDGTEIRAGELLADCNRVAHALRSLGLEPGDTVAAILPNGRFPATVYLAALQIGLYYVPINYRLSPPEIAYILARLGREGVHHPRALRRRRRRRPPTRRACRPRGGSPSGRCPASGPSTTSSPASPTPHPTSGSPARRCTTRAARPVARRG